MTDRKINRAALCFAMSLVLALCGCAAAAPAAGQGSTGKEAAGQESTMQANAGQEAAGGNAGQEVTGQEVTGQETAGEEMSAQTTVEEDEFDFEEGDPNTPAADGEMPSKAPLRRRRSAFSAAGWRRTTVIQQRLSICRRSTWHFLPTLH